MFIDTHAHLFYPNFSQRDGFPEGELDEILSRARQDGIDYILVPATDLKTAEQVLGNPEPQFLITATVRYKFLKKDVFGHVCFKTRKTLFFFPGGRRHCG